MLTRYLSSTAGAFLLASLSLQPSTAHAADPTPAIALADAGTRTATVKWFPPTGATTFNLFMSSARDCDVANYRSCPEGFMFANVTQPYLVTFLGNNKAYFFKVESVFPDGTRSVSNEAFARPNVAAFDGDPRAITPSPDGSTIYVGGNFTSVGALTGSAIPLDAQTGRLISPDFPIVDGTVNASAADGAGGWYLGGTFSQVGGVALTNLAHILPNGAVDAGFRPNPDGTVLALGVSGGSLYVGGAFTHLAGVTRLCLGALNTAGGVLPWNPSPLGTVRTLAIADDVIYFGGDFSSVGGSPHKIVAAAAADTNGSPLSWDPHFDPRESFSFVTDLAVSATHRIFIAGDFQTVNGVQHPNAVAVEADGSLAAWDPQPNGPISALGISGNTVYIGGAFNRVSNQPRASLASYAVDTGSLLDWRPETDGAVESIATSGSSIYLAGSFTRINTTQRSGFAAVNPNGAVLPWDARASGRALTLAVAGNTVYAAGDLSSVAATPRANLAALDINGVLLPWNPGAGGEVNAMLFAGNTLYVGGSFQSLGGRLQPNLGALDQRGVLDERFNNAMLGTLNGRVRALATIGDMLYAGGEFSERLASYFKVDAASSAGLRSSWIPGLDGNVRALASSSNFLYAAGAFRNINSVPAGRFARFNAARDPINPRHLSSTLRIDGDVDALATVGFNAFVVGRFSEIRVGDLPPQSRAGFSLIPSGDGLGDWPARPDTAPGGLTTRGNNVYVLGHFAAMGGKPRAGLALVHPDGSVDDAFRPELGLATSGGFRSAIALSPAGDRVYVGGSFSTVNRKPRGKFVILDAAGNPVE